MNKTCFEIKEALNGKYMITPIHDNFFLESTEGSFNIIGARLFNLSYANYLRMCRDIYGAELYGKNTIYVVPYFKEKSGKTKELLEELNNRANEVLKNRNKNN